MKIIIFIAVLIFVEAVGIVILAYRVKKQKRKLPKYPSPISKK